jgi:hypothetical protein
MCQVRRIWRKPILLLQELLFTGNICRSGRRCRVPIPRSQRFNRALLRGQQSRPRHWHAACLTAPRETEEAPLSHARGHSCCDLAPGGGDYRRYRQCAPALGRWIGECHVPLELEPRRAGRALASNGRWPHTAGRKTVRLLRSGAAANAGWEFEPLLKQNLETPVKLSMQRPQSPAVETPGREAEPVRTPDRTATPNPGKLDKAVTRDVMPSLGTNSARSAASHAPSPKDGAPRRPHWAWPRSS